MAISKQIRLLASNPLNAVNNMAVDLAVFKSYCEGGAKPTLRFYSWVNPTITIGKYQDIKNIDLEACKQKGIEVVKRPTGGRAVLHLPSEITYSVIAGGRAGFPSSIAKSYAYICRPLSETLRYLGIKPVNMLRKQGVVTTLCYLSTSLADIAVDNKKIIGSAQFREGPNFLQHGSIPLEVNTELIKWGFKFPSVEDMEEEISNYLAVTTNLSDELGFDPNRHECIKSFIKGFEKSWGCEFSPEPLDDKEISYVKYFVKKIDRYL